MVKFVLMGQLGRIIAQSFYPFMTGTIVVCVITGVCEYVASTPKPLVGGVRPSVCPRSDKSPALVFVFITLECVA